MSAVTVSVIACNEIVREGLRRILISNDCIVLASVSSAEELLGFDDEAGSSQIVIIDTRDGDHGPESCVLLRQQFPSLRLVLIAEDCAVATIIRALAVGADGYLWKGISSESLISALRMIACGEKVVPTRMITELVGLPIQSSNDKWDADRLGVSLSDRELQTLTCLTSGDANKLISRQLNITEATVKVHIKAILRKLQVGNRTQAAIWAVSNGMPNHKACATNA